MAIFDFDNRLDALAQYESGEGLRMGRLGRQASHNVALGHAVVLHTGQVRVGRGSPTPAAVLTVQVR